MNLMVLLAPVGVLFLVLLTWVLGGNKVAELSDEQAALARFKQDFFDFEAREIALSGEGHHSALLVPANEDDGIGLVFALGDNYATRFLHKGDVAKLAVKGNAVSFRINEFTGRKIDFACEDAATANQWADRLRALAA